LSASSRLAVAGSSTGPPGVGAAQSTASVNSTAATPSLNRLSASVSSRSRPPILLSLNIAITATGSVAAISVPNTAAGATRQPSPHTMPAVTAAAEISVPKTASTSTGPASRFSSSQRILIAASNSSAGRMMS
jgi:hypothetical protein